MAYSCTLGLRYGLVAAAAAFYALETSESTEERELKQLFQYWPVMVTDHYRQEIAYRLPAGYENIDPAIVGRLAGSPLRVSLALRKQFLPLQRVLEIAAEIFNRDHRGDITADSWLLARPRTVKIFRSAAEESVRYSMHFFERRRQGLEEVSEIALLGE